MNFSQLLEKYENGFATPEEQRLVEEEARKKTRPSTTISAASFWRTAG